MLSALTPLAVKTGLAGLLVGGLLACGAGVWGLVERSGRLAAEKEVAALERDHALALAAGEKKLGEVIAARAAESAALQVKVQEASNERDKALARNRVVAADLARTRLERDGLRDEIDRYASGRGTEGDDTLPACRERAATLGRLVEAGLSVQESLADRAETCEADKRTLLRAWPRNGSGEEQ